MKLKSSWILFVPAFIASFALQLYDCVFDLARSSTSFTVICVCIALLLGTGFFAILDKFTVRDYAPRKNIFSGVFLGIAGTLITSDSAFSILNMLGEPIEPLTLITAIFGVGAAVVIILLGINSITGLFTLRAVPIATLVPTIYFALRLVSEFLSYTKEAVASSEMYDLLYLVLLIIFFFYCASIFGGIPTKSAIKCCFVFGLPAVVMITAWATKMLYPVFTGSAQFDFYTYLPEFQAIALALFITSFLIEISLKPAMTNYFDFDSEDFSEEEEIYGKKTERRKIDTPVYSVYTPEIAPQKETNINREVVETQVEKKPEKKEEISAPVVENTQPKKEDIVREKITSEKVEEPRKSSLEEQAQDYRIALSSYEEQIHKENAPQKSIEDDMGWIDRLIKEIEEEQKNG